MHSILFLSEDLPLKPAMAAAWVRLLQPNAVSPSVAARRQEFHDPNVLQVMAETGLIWPAKVLAADNLKLFPFDLVISFAGKKATRYPALPGNPPIIYWHLEDPPRDGKGNFDFAGCRTLRVQLYQLVRDLLQQGYLTAMVQARKNAELVLDNLHEGIIAHDLDRHIFFFNKAAEKITGFSRNEILGRDCHDVFTQGFCNSKCSFCGPTDARPSLSAQPYQIGIRTKSGEERQIEMSLVPINDFFNNPVGVVASLRDVTREQELVRRLGFIESFAGIIGRDPQMHELFRTIKDLADSNASVLLQGESGTGKELVAAAIHNEGKRAGKLFVPVNCGALPETLLESELFGHVKGAFTGATHDKKGRFELAHGGTLFLDEIGDISPAMQVKLLRVLQDGIFQRVGGEEMIKVDVRIISATHKDLKREISSGRFREDLYYRLCVVPLQIPPLRSRRNDIPLLARHFLKKVLAEEGRTDVTIAPDTMDMLLQYDWPGNVREMQNTIRYLLVRCRDSIINPRHLPPNIQQQSRETIKIKPPHRRRLKLTTESVRKALAETNGNRLQAARLLKVGRATLYRFLDHSPIQPETESLK